VRRAGTLELLVDDGCLQGIGGLLRAAPTARDVPVEVPALDRLQAKRRLLLRRTVAADHRGGAVLVAVARLRRPAGRQEVAHLTTEPLILRTVFEIHGASSRERSIARFTRVVRADSRRKGRCA